MTTRDAYHTSLVTAAGAFALRVGRSKLLRMALLATALAAFSLASLVPHFSVPAIVVGVFSLFLVASSWSHAGRLAASLQRLQARLVEVHVWGVPLDAESSSRFEVASITALSAGLLIYLRCGSGGAQRLLKVAQPEAVRVEERSVEIDRAAYVSWGGIKAARVAGVPAVVIVVPD